MQKHLTLWVAPLAEALALFMPVISLVKTRQRILLHLASGESGDCGMISVEWRVS